jgi:DNA-directed RNA polymerase subunit RPC12/RpoP
MDLRCPQCGKEGLVPVTGAVLNDSYAIASHFSPFAALHIIIEVVEEEQEERELFLVCRYCGYLKPFSPFSTSPRSKPEKVVPPSQNPSSNPNRK